jgi:hypothetical protein
MVTCAAGWGAKFLIAQMSEDFVNNVQISLMVDISFEISELSCQYLLGSVKLAVPTRVLAKLCPNGIDSVQLRRLDPRHYADGPAGTN